MPLCSTFTHTNHSIHLTYNTLLCFQLATASAVSSISIRLFLLLRFPLRKSTGNDKRVIDGGTADDEQGIDLSLVIVKTSLMGDGSADDVGDVLGDDKLDSVDDVVVFEQLLLSLHLRRSLSSDVNDSDTSICEDGSPSDADLLNSQVAPSSLSSYSDGLLLLVVDFKTPAAFKLCSSSRSCPMKFRFGEMIGRFCFTTL